MIFSVNKLTHNFISSTFVCNLTNYRWMSRPSKYPNWGWSLLPTFWNSNVFDIYKCFKLNKFSYHLDHYWIAAQKPIYDWDEMRLDVTYGGGPLDMKSWDTQFRLLSLPLLIFYCLPSSLYSLWGIIVRKNY